MLPKSSGRPARHESGVPHFYLWLTGEARQGISTPLSVSNPFDGSLVATASVAGRRQIREAIESSRQASEKMKRMPRHSRAELLRNIAGGIKASATELTDALVMEAGKPRSFAELEVKRTITTFTIASEEARRFCGEQIPMDATTQGEGYSGYSERLPLGVIFGITPFNFPLNLVAHKVAPALAAGNSIIIKPSSRTPICALILARIITEAGAPAGAVNVLPMHHKDVSMLLHSDHIRFLTFTGSADVGWGLKQLVHKQKVALELGGNSGSYVDRTADISRAAERLALGGFVQAGQSCIAVQRIYVHREIYDAFLSQLTAVARKIKVGNPQHKDVQVGPVISMKAADRIIRWIREAEAGGATVVLGGKQQAEKHGRIIQPTILTDVKESMQVCCKEVFGPVVTVTPVAGVDEAVQRINGSPFGLQAAIFSHDLPTVEYATRHLEVGGIIINDFPTYRADHMPYGGVKASGMGREGIRSAMLEMSEEKMIVTRLSRE